MNGILTAIKNVHLLDFWSGLGDWVGSFLGTFLWVFCDIFFVILDLFETLFRKFAGIDNNITTGSKGGEKIEGDLVLYFINSDLVQEIFFSIVALSFILLVIFTIFAIVKNQYAEKQEPVSKIINSSVKAMLMYLLVPVATIVCLIVGNIVLQAIDGATKLNSSGGVSDMLFSSAAYNANRLRQENPAEELLKMYKENNLTELMQYNMKAAVPGLEFNADKLAALTDEDWAILAEVLDETFINEGLSGGTSYDSNGNEIKRKETRDKWNIYIIDDYYKPLKLSYITIWAGGAFLIWAIGKITWGLVARLFKMVLFFALSPAVMATFPIQGDKALSGWRSEMVKNGTSAYCAVGVLNVLYSILPFFNNIDLFGDSVKGQGLATSIARLFIYIIAFSSAQSLISTVSGWFGTGNALEDGKAAKGMVDKWASPKTVTTKALGALGAYQGGVKAATDNGKNKFWQKVGGGLQGVYTQTGFGKELNKMRGDYQTAYKGGKDQYKQFATSGFAGFGLENEDKLAAFEGRAAMGKEVKKIDKLVDALEKEKAQALVGLTGEAYIKMLEKYDKKINELKASAEHLKVLFEEEAAKLERDKQSNDVRSANFAVVDSYRKSIKSINGYKKKIMELLEKQGFSVDEGLYEELKSGDYSSIIGDENKQKVQAVFSTFSEGMFQAEQAKENAMQGIQNLAESGADGVEYLKGVFGALITDDGKFASGASESILLHKIKKEQEGINEAVKKWKEDNDNIIVKRAEMYGKLVGDDLVKYGKNQGK